MGFDFFNYLGLKCNLVINHFLSKGIKIKPFSLQANPFAHLAKKAMDILSRFSVEQEDVVGVDITPSYIRVAQLSKQGNRWVLDKFGYKYLDDAGESMDVNSHVDFYVQKLRELVVASKLTTLNAAVSIPVTSAIIRVISLPLMTDEEIQNAIDMDSLWENVIQLSESLDEYSVFWQVIRRDAATNVMDILFVASKLSDIKAYSNIVSAAGLNPVLVDVRCFAVRNALNLLPELATTTQTNTILEIGLYENYLLVVNQGSPFISDVYLSEADRALLRAGMEGKSTQDLMGFYDRYSTQVRQAIRAFESRDGAEKVSVGQIKVTSPLSNIQDMLPLLSQKLPEYGITLLDATEFLAIPEQLKAKVTAERNPSVFTSVLGLATRKLDIFGYYKYVTGVNNINLLPNRDSVRKVEKTKIISKIAIVFFGLLIALGIGLTLWHQADEEEALTPQVTQVDQLSAEVVALEGKIAKIRAQRKEYEQLLVAASRFDIQHQRIHGVLQAVAMTIPAGVRLTALTYEGGETLRIEGEVANEQLVTHFLEALSRSSVLQKVTLLNMGSETATSGILFKFDCTLKPLPSATGNPLRNNPVSPAHVESYVNGNTYGT